VEEARTRIKITVGDATIEVEGSQDYVEKKLKEPQSFGGLVKQVSGVVPAIPAKVEAKGQEAKAEKRKKITKGETYKTVPNLNLSGTDDIPPLKDFYKEKSPAFALECNAVFIYYLKKMLKIDRVSIEHVYTCYKAVGVKVPGKLYQSLADTQRRKATIITSDMEDLGISTIGENFVEQELPKSHKSK
jgi:hypothetical protein